MKKKLTLIISILCFVSAFTFVNKVAAQAKSAPASAGAKSQKLKMPKMPDIDSKKLDFIPKTVAKVGKDKITKKQLVNALKPKLKMMKAMGKELNKEQYHQMAKRMAEQLVRKTVLKDMAADAGYKVTPKIKKEAYQKLKSKFEEQLPEESDLGFEEMMKKQGLNMEDVKEQMAEGQVIQKWIKDKIEPQIEVTDHDAKQFYENNKKRFKKPETVKASHILIKPEDTSSDKDWKNAKKEAEKIAKKLRDGADFEKMAEKHSQGPSAKQGGKLGNIKKGQMAPKFEEACWTMVKEDEKDEIDLVKTKYGWHIIKVTDHQESGHQKLNKDLLKRIKQQLKNQKVAKKVKKLEEKKQEELNTEINL